MPPLFPIREIGGDADTVYAVIIAWTAMLSRLMSRKVNEDVIQDYERHIKIFLINFSRFDTALRGENHCTCIKCYNFMSLLNLPEVLSHFGSLLNLWKGG